MPFLAKELAAPTGRDPRSCFSRPCARIWHLTEFARGSRLHKTNEPLSRLFWTLEEEDGIDMHVRNYRKKQTKNTQKMHCVLLIGLRAH